MGGEDDLIAEFEDIVLCQDLLPLYAKLAQQIQDEGDDGQDNRDRGLMPSKPQFVISW